MTDLGMVACSCCGKQIRLVDSFYGWRLWEWLCGDAPNYCSSHGRPWLRPCRRKP
jgi:hypothetical protein